MLAVPRLMGIAGGPHDLAAFLGHLGEPDHPDCQRWAASAAQRAHATGKVVWSDVMVCTELPKLIFGAARSFTVVHRQDAEEDNFPRVFA
jgi:hypothetical protein